MDRKEKLALAPLTDEQEQFCQLMVGGGRDFAGQQEKCYRDVFGHADRQEVSFLSRQLMARENVASRIKELARELMSETEIIATKLQVAETLKGIMEETSRSNFTDRFDMPVSPAPLRAVAVNAAKALMEIYPIKHVHETKLSIEAENGGRGGEGRNAG